VKEIIVTSNVPSADIGKLDKLTEVSITEFKASSVIVAQTTSVEDPSFNVKVTNYGEDLIRQPQLFKYNQDTFSKIDLFIKAVNKGINESISKFETLSLSTGKPQQDMLISFDSVILQWDRQRVFLEIVSKVDYITLLSNKGVSDNGSVSELLSKGIQPSFQDYKTLSEVFSRLVTYNITLLDNIQSTDDFLGLANIDDDQVAAVQKNLIEFRNTNDLLSFGLSNNYFDSFNDSDLVVISPNKVINDISNINSELLSFNINKRYEDISEINDILSIDLSIKFIDTVFTTDLVDLLKITVWNVNDSTTASDDVLGVANADDDQTAAIGKNAFENIINTDSVNTLTGLNKNEQVSKSDSGLINNQGYFSSNYIIPDYVGTNTSF
jgi:hypothetical protein